MLLVFEGYGKKTERKKNKTTMQKITTHPRQALKQKSWQRYPTNQDEL